MGLSGKMRARLVVPGALHVLSHHEEPFEADDLTTIGVTFEADDPLQLLFNPSPQAQKATQQLAQVGTFRSMIRNSLKLILPSWL